MGRGRNRIETFPARLVELRAAAGMTREQLAVASGTSFSSVTSMELGTRSPSLELAGRLANALGVTVDTMLLPAGQPIDRVREVSAEPVKRGRPRGKPATET